MAGALRAPIMAAMSGRGITTSLPKRGLRLARTALHLLHGLWTVAAHFPFYSLPRRRAAVRGWSARLLRILGVQLHAVGDAPDGDGGPVMLVANHVSWLDIFVINAVLPVRFVAKSEIRSWPAIGWLSAKTGTLFIERARRGDAARISREIADAMTRGDVVAVFPEGTTTDGSQVLRFHGALLQPALIAGASVHPVALRFERGDGSLCAEAAYDGDKSLLQSVLAIVAQPDLHARLWFLPALPPDAAHRRELAAAARQLIADRLRP
ncbi:MAG: 1-acyl-sn-glycerol-3-phosphate acyltransferase [Burkholderiales bacterium]|jgi:1-acyl-sn-glycerol-3-phosphate acyltransferase|nr:1-acyl-sn-glycerol-3-phosphate acyltransferase [Burkholderiales bacterium]